MRILKEEFGDRLDLKWRSFLLRPEPQERSLESFRKYTQSWLRVASDEPSGDFQPWQTDEGPPSYSIPPHLVAKAAAEVGEDAFQAIHDALLHAYFKQNRDITATPTLTAIWLEAGLEEKDFARAQNPDFVNQVIEEHNEAISFGASGAPAFRMAHHTAAITGAHPVETLRRWVNQVLAGEA